MTDPQTAPALHAIREWRCFHCDEVFTDEAEAREHFGANESRQVACRLTERDVKQLRTLETLNEKLRRELDHLENDARLWHEAETDRVRRIGNCQWWQEMDSREGEKLVLQERVAELEAALIRLSGPPEEVVEALAAYAHEAWSGWMRHLFSKCHSRPSLNGMAVTIPGEWAERWMCQMNTPYAELREDEKESDRQEARRMLAIVSRLSGQEPKDAETRDNKSCRREWSEHCDCWHDGKTCCACGAVNTVTGGSASAPQEKL